HGVGSSNAPLLGSTAAEGLQRIGRTSIATRWRFCGLPQSASCSENFVIPPDVFGQTLGFYLGSDTLRRYTLGELATSFAKHQYYPRGRRLVLYDAEGDFNRNFDWWRKDSSRHRFIEPQLPFENGRTDLLTGSGSRLDIQNINLLATLLVHAQYQGYWSQL